MFLTTLYFFAGRVPNHTIKLRAMDDCDEILIASNSTGRVAQVRGQELRRR
jgi:hypothetical protein